MLAVLPQPDVVEESVVVSRALRVAFVTETYPPEINGVALTVARIVEGLHRRRHVVQLIRPSQMSGDPVREDERFQEVLVRGLPIPLYPTLRMGAPSKRALVRLWADRRPDVVHIATEGPLGWSALQAARLLQLPVCSDFRTNFHAYAGHYGIGWLERPLMAYLRSFHNHTQLTMVPTEALRRELQGQGFVNLSVVSRGVDVRQFAPQRRCQALRDSWGAGPEDLVVACVGRLAPEKNLRLVVEAFTAVRRSQTRAKLLLVGEGPMRDELQRVWPDAVFAGQRRGEDLARHYASADLFLFASQTETFGNVTAEAMASGLPVVAYNYAAAAQLMHHDDSGVLVPFGDSSAFVRAACRLADDAGRRGVIGKRARWGVGQFDWDRIVTRFEGELQRALHRGQLSRPLASARSAAEMG